LTVGSILAITEIYEREYETFKGEMDQYILTDLKTEIKEKIKEIDN